MFAEHVSVMSKFETNSFAVEMDGDSGSISKFDLVSVADAMDCFFVSGFVPTAQPLDSCSCPLLLEFFLWVLLTWEEEDMGVLPAAEFK
jgi:hypothetical protein